MGAGWMSREHRYSATITWTGNLGQGTTDYKAYARDHVISIAGKPDIAASADPAFRGDISRYNPEDLLLASVCACHMLWYLHLCAEAGVVVVAYVDAAKGVMAAGPDGRTRFDSITLYPTVTLAGGGDPALARAQHRAAHEACFIANSVNFPIEVEPVIEIAR